jgi:hypothetical protein
VLWPRRRRRSRPRAGRRVAAHQGGAQGAGTTPPQRILRRGGNDPAPANFAQLLGGRGPLGLPRGPNGQKNGSLWAARGSEISSIAKSTQRARFDFPLENPHRDCPPPGGGRRAPACSSSCCSRLLPLPADHSTNIMDIYYVFWDVARFSLASPISRPHALRLGAFSPCLTAYSHSHLHLHAARRAQQKNRLRWGSQYNSQYNSHIGRKGSFRNFVRLGVG